MDPYKDGSSVADGAGPGESGEVEASQTVGDPVRFDSSGNVEVYIHLASTDEASLSRSGMPWKRSRLKVLSTASSRRVNPDELETVASLDAVKRITPPDYGYTNAGSRVTEGDAVHRANLVRASSGLTGEGVKVGVISDGVGAWTTARATGDLPSSIELWDNNLGLAHEGTAMLEIIHGISPGAELAFSGLSTLATVKSILWLANEAFEEEGAESRRNT